MQPGTSLAGTLDTLPLPELLTFLATRHEHGVLSFAGDGEAMLVLADGAIALGLSDAGPTLEQVIVGSGIADLATWQRATQDARTTGSVAQALLDLGVAGDELAAVLREQTVGVVFELLLPGERRFELEPGASHPVGDTFTVPVDELLAEAAARIEGWRPIAASVPSTTAVLVPVRHLASDEVVVSAADWSVLAVLDGRRTVADLVHELGLSAFTVCAVLHHLREAGLVEPT